MRTITAIKQSLGALVLAIGVISAGQSADLNNLDNKMHSFVPQKGFVPDEPTAAAIAEAVLIPIYGKRIIERQKPFTVSLTGDTWTITGSLPEGQLGGVFVVELAKHNGAVLRVSHGR